MDVHVHIPAWKRVGLQLQKGTEDDNALTPVHLEEANLTHKQKKKLVGRNREEIQEKDKLAPRKPPKKLKKPKSERGPPPEKDQLAYLRQFEYDRANWKFSKQKQNWILKNLKHIPSHYENSLKIYISSIQGGSRERLIDDLVDVIQKWNQKIEEMDAKIEKQLEQLADNSSHTEKIEEENPQYGEEKTSSNSDQPDNTSEIPSESADVESSNNDEITKGYVRRCGILLKFLGREDITVRGIDLSEGGNDVDEPINAANEYNGDNEAASKSPNGNVHHTFIDRENRESLKRSKSADDGNDEDDPLLISSVDVTGISESASHVSQVEKNRLKRLKLDDKASVSEQDDPAEISTEKTSENKDKEPQDKHSSKKKKKSSKKGSNKKKK